MRDRVGHSSGCQRVFTSVNPPSDGNFGAEISSQYLKPREPVAIKAEETELSSSQLLSMMILRQLSLPSSPRRDDILLIVSPAVSRGGHSHIHRGPHTSFSECVIS
jgi:hypothetical protein